MNNSFARGNGQGDGPVLLCSNLTRNFRQGPVTLEVLSGVDLEVQRGETVSIIGASGSGKTTLLQLLGGLDSPTTGNVRICGQDISGLNDAERGILRNRSVGFVYQFHHLLPEFSALENVAMPLLIRRMPPGEARDKAASLLDRVGLGERLTHRPAQLSGGERQRAAVARALISEPDLVLADEPTGNLDKKTGDKVFNLMLELNRELGTALVVVTHDPDIANRMSRVLTLSRGMLRAGE